MIKNAIVKAERDWNVSPVVQKGLRQPQRMLNLVIGRLRDYQLLSGGQSLQIRLNKLLFTLIAVE
jgi:hypothetical protein